MQHTSYVGSHFLRKKCKPERSYDLVFAKHTALLEELFGVRRPCHFIIRKFTDVIRSIVRTMNQLPPYSSKLSYTVYDDRITLKSRFNSEKLESLIIKSDDTYYFAPWIYVFENKSARLIITKQNLIEHRYYLVHRSQPNGELQFPGGHLEFIETYYCQRTGTLIYETAISYVRLLIERNPLPDEIQDNTQMWQWIKFGVLREVQEESGLDLSSYIESIRYVKTGDRTFYTTVEVEPEIHPEGPLPEFAHEIYNQYDRYDQVDRVDRSKNKQHADVFDEFWSSVVDRTRHAWLSADELVNYWNPEYKDHVTDLIQLI